MSLQIECYRATVTEKFKRFEDLSDADKLSVSSRPLSPNTFNICMEVEWETKDKTPCGSGFKYLLINPRNLHNLATNVIVGYDTKLNKISVVRIIGDVYWAVKNVYPDILTEMLPWSDDDVNEKPLVRLLLDEVVRNTIYPREKTIINYH
jgi:hypothetical protein